MPAEGWKLQGLLLVVHEECQLQGRESGECPGK